MGWRLQSLGLAALIGLAGCGGLDRLRPEPARESVSVARNSVTIAGPPGYCIDDDASSLRGETPFVLLGSCAAISGDDAAKTPVQLGVLTAVVSRPGGPSFAETLPQLEAFLASSAGRSALARDGRADSVKVLSARQSGAAMIVHLEDTSANIAPGIMPEYWRGLFEVNGRLVTVSVMSFENLPMGSEASVAMLGAFIDRIRQATRPQGETASLFPWRR